MNKSVNWSAEILDACDEVITRPVLHFAGEMRVVQSAGQVRSSSVEASEADGGAEPRGAACLTKILGAIKAGQRQSPQMAARPCALYLHVLDDIDFDCQQPFLAEVLGELVSNAVHAMRGQTAGRIDVMTTQYRGRLFVQVADNGPGMPDGMFKWFEQGATSRVHRKGSGLDTAALLVSIAGGQLELVASGPNGTRLGFSVPVAADREINLGKGTL
ncbi:ATP-binding protein [uncultured Tateyamaria sp.]|uniref:ATP-binding protein n=1 Tax=uncultured Tateyamaria sp. TaxID=455651 RepID=UPI00261C7818|nr:ATP-binding protein [uncultured Tateyamaria sp.]